MRIEVHNDADSAAHKAAAIIAADARKAVMERGRFVFAVSGGKTPWLMLCALADEDVPWGKVHPAQADERLPWHSAAAVAFMTYGTEARSTAVLLADLIGFRSNAAV